MGLRIVTNNQPRHGIDWDELTDAEKGDFDYRSDVYDYDLVRYRGHVYDLGEFMRCPSDGPMSFWTGYASDSFFSGVLVKYADDDHGCDEPIMATYYS